MNSAAQLPQRNLAVQVLLVDLHGLWATSLLFELLERRIELSMSGPAHLQGFKLLVQPIFALTSCLSNDFTETRKYLFNFAASWGKRPLRRALSTTTS